MQQLIDTYFSALQENNPSDINEHSLRTGLENLLKGLIAENSDLSALKVLQEPKREGRFGTPDFKISNLLGSIGYCETKKVGENLGEIIKTPQIQKYLELSDNLLLTDYCTFIWIKEKIETKKIVFCSTEIVGDKKAKIDSEKAAALVELLCDFLRETPKGIATSQALAKALAARTRTLKEFLYIELANPDAADNVPRLFGLYQTFQQTVSSDLTHSAFADAYAQMLAYGLFLAKLNADTQPVLLHTAKQYIPNAFELIKELTGFLEDLQDVYYQPIRWVINEILTILNHLDLRGIQENLSFNKTRDKDNPEDVAADPYIYFYEDFLGQYDPALRKSKGVYYTPPAVVNFMVRAIDKVLQDTFQLKEGLAAKDTVSVLDFATGTGTFLLEIVRQILGNTAPHSSHFSEMIKTHILKNLYGFEYMIAPYTIAHLKLSQFLHEKGYDFQGKERLQIFLTNTLEPLNTQSNFLLPALSKEGIAAQNIKKQPILVITGNPPYAGNSSNKGKWITERINEYKKMGNEALQERNPKWLQDDYVKFIRFAEWKMQQVNEGMIAVITSNSFLDNPTFRLMRKSLMTTFNHLYIIDLHGNAKKKETSPDGTRDQNVFDIQQGVSISIFVKKAGLDKKIFHTDFWGTRKNKFNLCFEHDLKSINWVELQPQMPHYLFVPQDITHQKQYEKGWNVKDIFNLNGNGIISKRDVLATDFDKQNLVKKLTEFADFDNFSNRDIAYKFNLPLRDNDKWDLNTARLHINKEKVQNEKIVSFNYRPFSKRFLYFDEVIVARLVKDLTKHFEKPNIALVTGRAGHNVGNSLWNLCFVTDTVSDINLFYRGGATVFPLFYYNGNGNGNGSNGNGYLFNEDGKKDNFTPAFRQFIKTRYSENKTNTAELENLIAEIKELILINESTLIKHKKLNINGISDIEMAIEKAKKQLDLREKALEMAKNNVQTVAYQPEPREVFDYMYGFLHSPIYRAKYVDFLKMDFPHILFPEDLATFQTIATIGKELAAVHLMQAYPALKIGEPMEIYTNEVTAISYRNERLYYNEKQYFDQVSEDIWNFEIGGYKVLEKFLKDRKGQNILQEWLHIQKVINILDFSLQKMKELEGLTEKWI